MIDCSMKCSKPGIRLPVGLVAERLRQCAVHSAAPTYPNDMIDNCVCLF